jgi:hypothetical protein
MKHCFPDLDGKYGPFDYFQSTCPVQIASEAIVKAGMR